MGVKKYIKKWEELASYIYLIAYAVIITFSLKKGIEYFTLNSNINNINYYLFLISLFIFLLCLYLFIEGGWESLKWNVIKQYLNLNLILFVFIFGGLYYGVQPISENVSYFLLDGRVTISMDNVYHTKDIEIPASIKITGWNNGTKITLFQKNSANNLVSKASVSLKSGYDSNRTIETGNNSILIGNTLDNQRYNIFINASNLSVGYYELVSEPWERSKKFSYGFYIVQ